MKILVFCLVLCFVPALGCSASTKAHTPTELFAVNHGEDGTNGSTQQTERGYTGSGVWVQPLEFRSHRWLEGPNLTRVDMWVMDRNGDVSHLGTTDASTGGILPALIYSGGYAGGQALRRPTRVDVTHQGGGANASAQGGQGGDASAGASSSSSSGASATATSN